MKIRSVFAVLVATFMVIGVAGCDTEDALVIPDEKVDDGATSGGESGDENVTPGENENPGEEPAPGEGEEEDDGGYNTDGPFVPPVITEPLSSTIRPTLVVGKRWEYIIDNTNRPDKDVPFTLKCTRDSVFDGYEGKVIREVERNGRPVPELYSTEYFYREDGPVVYHLEHTGAEYDYGDGSWTPIWEFQKHWWYDPSAGMEFRSLHGWECVVSRGTIVLQGVERRALKVWTYKFLTKVTPRYDYWVEGIGSLFGHDPIYDEAQHKHYNTVKLKKCYEGDKLIYDSREFREELYTPIEVYSDIDKQQQ